MQTNETTKSPLLENILDLESTPKDSQTIELNLLESKVYSLISSSSLENPISSFEIKKLIAIESSEVRSIVHKLRNKHIPICANKKGYYMANHSDELTDYLIRLNQRIQEQLNAHISLSSITDVKDHLHQVKLDASFNILNQNSQMSLAI